MMFFIYVDCCLRIFLGWKHLSAICLSGKISFHNNKLYFLSLKYFLTLLHCSPAGVLTLGVHVPMILHNYSKFIFLVPYRDLRDFTSFVIRMCFSSTSVSLYCNIVCLSKGHHIGVIIPSGQFVMETFLFLCLVWLCYVVSFKGHMEH